MRHTDPKTLKATMRRHGICVLIPTYNNAGTLRDVVSGCRQYCDDIIVVDDGSTDETSRILGSMPGIDVVTLSRNRGKGAALKKGFRRAIGRGFRHAITLDSDGQHYPENIEDFVKAIIENPGALIIGERDLSSVDINGKSSFANKFSNFWFNLQTGKRLRDTQTGFRAYPLGHLHGLPLLTDRYEAELELLVFAAWNGVEIIPIPIDVYYPPRGQRVSHFRPGPDFTRISILNTILCFGAILYGLPARTWNALAKRKIFRKEFSPFTKRDGKRRNAAITMERLVRSVGGFTFFGFLSAVIFTPFTHLYFLGGKDTEKRRLRFHKMLQGMSRFITRIFPGATTRYENRAKEDFEKPAVIICNHQSHLDLPVIMSLSPRMIFLTNDWVWENPVYGNIIHRAEFLPVSSGLDSIMPRLRKLRDRGYSIVVFPEGTRSDSCSILRFHQGAFHLARELQMDILPMAIHGAGHYLPKRELMFRKGRITLRILERIRHEERDPEIPLRKEASICRRLLKSHYDEIAARQEKSAYFKPLVFYRYAYRGWDTVAQCKRILKRLPSLSPYIDSEDESIRTIRILNGGIGVFPLLYALVNKGVEVYAFEANLRNFTTAKESAGVPLNLHYMRPVWENDYQIPGVSFDKTIRLTEGGARVAAVDTDNECP